jgi:hypothetical protein
MITKYKIIEELAKNKTIENIIQNIVKKWDDTLNDLAQMLYEDLLSKQDNKIIQLYNNNQLHYYLTRMVLNSVNSKTSRFYYLFARHNRLYTPLKNER